MRIYVHQENIYTHIYMRIYVHQENIYTHILITGSGKPLVMEYLQLASPAAATVECVLLLV